MLVCSWPAGQSSDHGQVGDRSAVRSCTEDKSEAEVADSACLAADWDLRAAVLEGACLFWLTVIGSPCSEVTATPSSTLVPRDPPAGAAGVALMELGPSTVPIRSVPGISVASDIVHLLIEKVNRRRRQVILLCLFFPLLRNPTSVSSLKG